MKNKLFWPIIIVAIVIMVESVLLLSNSQGKNNVNSNQTKVLPTQEIKSEDVVSFDWLREEGKAILVMKANKEIAIDAIDLYIGFKDIKVTAIKNLGVLPKPSFSKISTEKSLVVMNYLISETDGFKVLPNQYIKVAEMELNSITSESAELFIDTKTQVVENGTAKVLPFSSKNLIVNSTL